MSADCICTEWCKILPAKFGELSLNFTKLADMILHTSVYLKPNCDCTNLSQRSITCMCRQDPHFVTVLDCEAFTETRKYGHGVRPWHTILRRKRHDGYEPNVG